MEAVMLALGFACFHLEEFGVELMGLTLSWNLGCLHMPRQGWLLWA